MKLAGNKIGFAVTGSHCTMAEVMPQIERLVREGAEVFPIASPAAATTDTRFGPAAGWLRQLRDITQHEIIGTIVEAEPIGPQQYLDMVVVAPCTGNTMAKMANGIIDSPVLMAVKAQLRNLRPVVLAIATNDGLGMNARNLGLLLNIKNVYFVPFGQDDPENKQNSLVARMELVLETVICAFAGKQLQPILQFSTKNAS